MSLTKNQIKQLRKLAHHRKVIIIVGNAGVTENVLLEIDNALNVHELIKIRLNAADHAERTAMIEQIQQHTQADIIQTIGHVAVFYRQADKPVIELPKS
ncbi:MAG: YhbY family RNA-binding protein [Thioalkalispiraceae bacterium]|jgi:RNA-binding protein